MDMVVTGLVFSCERMASLGYELQKEYKTIRTYACRTLHHYMPGGWYLRKVDSELFVKGYILHVADPHACSKSNSATYFVILQLFEMSMLRSKDLLLAISLREYTRAKSKVMNEISKQVIQELGRTIIATPFVNLTLFDAIKGGSLHDNLSIEELCTYDLNIASNLLPTDHYEFDSEIANPLGLALIMALEPSRSMFRILDWKERDGKAIPVEMSNAVGMEKCLRTIKRLVEAGAQRIQWEVVAKS